MTQATMVMRLTRFGVPIVLFALSFAVIFLATSRLVESYDEGVVLTGAMQVLAGRIPHRDFYANYGPAQFYIIAALFKAFGPSVMVARVWGTLAKAAVVTMSFLLGRRVMSMRLSLAAAGFSLIWLAYVENTMWAAWPAFVATLASIFALLNAVERPERMKPVLLAGLFLGVAGLFRYDIGLILCPIEIALLIGFYATNRRPLLAAALRHYFLGALLVGLPFAVVLASSHAVGDVFFDIIAFPSHNYASSRSLPFPSLLGEEDGQTRVIVYFPLIAIASSVLVLLAPAFSRTNGAAWLKQSEFWKFTVLAGGVLCFFAKGFVRASEVHMSFAAVLSYVLVFALAASLARRGRAWALLLLTPTLVAGVYPSVDAAALLYTHIGWSIAGLRQSASIAPSDKARCSEQNAAMHMDCFVVDEQRFDAISYLRGHTRPGELLFVGVPDHSRIFANSLSIYFMSDLRPATKWYHFDPGLQTSEPIQRLIIRDLEINPPKYVVLDGSYDFVNEANTSSESSGVHLLDEFIRSHYRYATEFGAMMIVELNRPGVGSSAR